MLNVGRIVVLHTTLPRPHRLEHSPQADHAPVQSTGHSCWLHLLNSTCLSSYGHARPLSCCVGLITAYLRLRSPRPGAYTHPHLSLM